MANNDWVGDEVTARQRDRQEDAERARREREAAQMEKECRIHLERVLAETRAELAAERAWKGDPETAQFRAGMLAAAARIDDMRNSCYSYEGREQFALEAIAIRVVRLDTVTTDG